jgi:hypothetical protein
MAANRVTAGLLLIAAFAILAAGCASRQGLVESYTAPEMRRLEIGSVALMPLRDIWLSPAEASQLDEALAAMIALDTPGLEVQDAVEVAATMEDLALADRWQLFYDDYQIREMPDAAMLRLVGEALAVDAVFQGEISNVELEDAKGQILDQLSSGSDGESGTTLVPATEGTVKVTVDFTLFDTERGIRIWEAVAEGAVGIDPARPGELPVFEAARAALDRVARSLPLE